jgi:SAM-dependent methyltransferase
MRWGAVQSVLPAAAIDVLEVGCGQGGFGVRLSRRYPAYVGVEPDRLAFEVARDRLVADGGRGEARNGGVEVLDADSRFDLVCAFEVLEHIEDDRAALESWVARLRPGGTLLMSVPGFARRFAPADVMAGHFRRYDPPVLEELMRSVGLVDVEVRQFSGPLGYVLETARNQLGRRRLAKRKDESIEDRTAGSGRLFQPTSSPHAALAEHGTAPFRWLQDKGLGGGPGLLARARSHP